MIIFALKISQNAHKLLAISNKKEHIFSIKISFSVHFVDLFSLTRLKTKKNSLALLAAVINLYLFCVICLLNLYKETYLVLC